MIGLVPRVREISSQVAVITGLIIAFDQSGARAALEAIATAAPGVCAGEQALMVIELLDLDGPMRAAPTARIAQPTSAAPLYAMVAVSGAASDLRRLYRAVVEGLPVGVTDPAATAG